MGGGARRGEGRGTRRGTRAGGEEGRERATGRRDFVWEFGLILGFFFVFLVFFGFFWFFVFLFFGSDRRGGRGIGAKNRVNLFFKEKKKKK